MSWTTWVLFPAGQGYVRHNVHTCLLSNEYRDSFLGVKLPEREANHLLHQVQRLRMRWATSPLSHKSAWRAIAIHLVCTRKSCHLLDTCLVILLLQFINKFH
jgi:hypothetical protein